jgi:hypothetical protein
MTLPAKNVNKGEVRQRARFAAPELLLGNRNIPAFDHAEGVDETVAGRKHGSDPSAASVAAPDPRRVARLRWQP